MKQTVIQLPTFSVAGLQARTNNRAEQNPQQSKIDPTIKRYFQENWGGRLLHHTNPGITYSIYTDYESDWRGDYTCVFGEEVPETCALPEGLSLCAISAQTYVQFTAGPGPMPHVVIETWQKIWQMTEAELGGKRSYLADFELYDERAQDPQKAVVDLYIGVKTAKH